MKFFQSDCTEGRSAALTNYIENYIEKSHKTTHWKPLEAARSKKSRVGEAAGLVIQLSEI